MNLLVENIAQELGVPVETVAETWEAVVMTAERDKGMKRDKFSSQDFKECAKQARSIVEREEEIRVADFFESDMGASEFLETLVSGNFAGIQNIVNRKKDDGVAQYASPGKVEESEIDELYENDIGSMTDEELEAYLAEMGDGELDGELDIPEEAPAPVVSVPVAPVIPQSSGIFEGVSFADRMSGSGSPAGNVPQCLR